MHSQWAQWQGSSQGLYGSLLRLQAPASWMQEQGSQGATSQPRSWILVGAALGGTPGEAAFWLASWCWALTSDCSYIHPSHITPDHRGNWHAWMSDSACHVTPAAAGLCPWARGEGQEQGHCSPEPGTRRLVVYLMLVVDLVIFFIFAADLLATWVADSPCMRMAMNCFDFQVDSGSTWGQEKVITKTFTTNYSNIFKIHYIVIFTKNLIISMIFYNLCNYVETSKSTDLTQKSPYVLQKTYKMSFHYS